MEAAEYTLMDAAEGRMWWYRALHVRLLQGLTGVSGRVLDAGCGTGGFLARLRVERPDLTACGLEWSGAAAAIARAKSGAAVLRGTVNALPFAPDTFDAVILADVLSHQAVDPAEAMQEILRILRPRGRVVLNLPAYRWLMSAHDRRVHNARRFTAASARALLRKGGLTPLRVTYWNGLLLPLMILQRKVLARGGEMSDVAVFPPWLDATLHAMTELERHLPVVPLAGGSVLAIAEKG